MNIKLQIILIASLFAISTAQPVHAINLRSLATIIATKTVTIVKNAKALVHNRAFQASVAVAGTLGALYLLARYLKPRYYINQSGDIPENMNRIEVYNPCGKVYLNGTRNRANYMVSNTGKFSYWARKHDGIYSISPYEFQTDRWTRFWDWFLRKHRTGHIFIEEPRNIPITIQVPDNPISRLPVIDQFFQARLYTPGLDSNSPHAVIINGFIDGQDPHQSVDVTVGPGDTIAVQNCTPQDVNGIYRNHFHYE